ncbi:DMT family transporter [Iodidimonas sp. SYSU 1G8]|uniref:DMT family transporter n=1 Tax=Iodidimonas sp. SYSU 1G8 TaxID=3133967 RepID=UPI0031FE9404
MTLPHFMLAVLVTLVWGFNVMVTKWGVDVIPPVFFAGLRFFVVALLLSPWLKPIKGQMWRMVWIGLTSGALHFGLILVGYSLTDHVAPVAVALQINIPFMVLLAVLFLGERVGPWRLAGMAVAFAGVMVLGFDPVAFDSPLALIVVCIGACFFAVSVILMRGMTGAHPMQVQAWIAVVSFPALFAVSFFMETGQVAHAVDAGWYGVLLVLYTGVGASIMGHGGMFYLLQRYPVTYMVPFMIAPPMLGVFFGIWLHDDPVTTKLAIGGLMTMGGVAIIQIREALKSRRQRLTGNTP